MVVFGGYDYQYIDAPGQKYVGLKNDVWMFTQGVGWQEINITNGTLPDARVHHTAVYDVLNDEMVIMGGSSFLRYQGTRYRMERSNETEIEKVNYRCGSAVRFQIRMDLILTSQVDFVQAVWP